MTGTSQIVKNRKARFEYEILEKYEAGISLVGTEVKSIRAGKIKITEAFCQINNNMELELFAMHISPYDFGNQFNHDPNRIRKLLMHKNEIRRIFQKVKEKGLTLVPLSLYFKSGYIKVEVGLCKGKNVRDKRNDIKAKDAKREVDREMKGAV